MRRLLSPLSLGLLLLIGCTAPPAGTDSDAPQRGQTVAELLVEGRAQLQAKHPDEAELTFMRAAQLDGSSVDTRIWVLRSWMDQGRSNETLDAIDDMAKSGVEGPAIDYLYGMAFTRRAQDKITMGTADASVQMNFEEAVGLLSSALEANPELYSDAYPALAHAAWMSLDLPRAREAAEASVASAPESGDARLLLGRIAFSQFREAHDATGDWNAEAQAHWDSAREALEAAAANYAKSDQAGEEYLMADARIQLANAWLWKEDSGEASAAYADAIGWAPDAVDFGQVRSLFTPEVFRATLESGLAKYRERTGPERDAALQWWLGYSRLDAEANVEAESAFQRALVKEPGFVNAWFYTALARYAQANWEGTADALRHGWEADPSTIVAAMQSDLELNLSKISYVVGWCAANGRLDEAGLLSRINAESALDVASYWSDLGLFLRDQGALAADPEAARRLHEEAYASYMRALELEPDDPQIMNDTAVMLHYYLDRDQDRALAMYETARALAEEKLASGNVPEELLPIFETALRDATNNHERLLLQIEGVPPEQGAPEEGAPGEGLSGEGLPEEASTGVLDEGVQTGTTDENAG